MDCAFPSNAARKRGANGAVTLVALTAFCGHRTVRQEGLWYSTVRTRSTQVQIATGSRCDSDLSPLNM